MTRRLRLTGSATTRAVLPSGLPQVSPGWKATVRVPTMTSALVAAGARSARVRRTLQHASSPPRDRQHHAPVPAPRPDRRSRPHRTASRPRVIDSTASTSRNTRLDLRGQGYRHPQDSVAQFVGWSGPCRGSSGDRRGWGRRCGCWTFVVLNEARSVMSMRPRALPEVPAQTRGGGQGGVPATGVGDAGA
jgi:hypothetical protein